MARKSFEKATPRDLEHYKQWLGMDLETASLAFFSASNVKNWVVPEKYDEYLSDIRRQLGSSSGHNKRNARNSTETSQRRLAQPPATAVIEISDNSSSENEQTKGNKKRNKKRIPAVVTTPVKRPRLTDSEVIEIRDSDDEPAAPTMMLKTENESIIELKVEEDLIHKPGQHVAVKDKMDKTDISLSIQSLVDTAKKDGRGKYILTKKMRVDDVEVFSGIPKRWPVSSPNTSKAFIIDFSKDPRATGQNQKQKGLDKFLKEADQDSWGQGTNGTTTRSVPIALLDNLLTRRSSHRCNGGLRCEFFDTEILNGYLRDDAEDISVMQAIFAGEQRQNEMDGGSVVAMTEIFYRLAKGMRCKKSGCDGAAVIKPLKKGPSNEGKNNFIGCERYRKGEEFQHRYMPIPARVDETILFQLMNNVSLNFGSTEEFDGPCYTFRHPRHGKLKYCNHTHFREGCPTQGKIVPVRCDVDKITYTSTDPGRPFIVVIFVGQHSHPPWAEEKPDQEAKKDLEKVLEAFGVLGATAEQLDNAPSTLAILGSMLSEKHDAFRNKRKLQDSIRAGKEKALPAGLDWGGVVERYEQDLKNLKPADQYIWHLRMEGDTKLVVTMNPKLAALIHRELYLVCDYTFKRVHGQLNEWEVVIWHRATEQRVTVARAYCNSMEGKAFNHVFEGFFNAVEKATGHKIKFKVFNKSGNILAIILDMEAAQVQGLGHALLRMLLSDPSSDFSTTFLAKFGSNPDILVQFIIKLCAVHFDRSTDKLVPVLGRDVVEYLNKFRALQTPEDMEAWNKFCKTHPSQELRNWYEHKTRYPWLLPGYNRSLSKMPNEYWDLTPKDSNLVETGHVASNRHTNINLSPVEAIEKARIVDARVAMSIMAAGKTCIPLNINNSEKARMIRNIGRQTHRAQQRSTHRGLDVEIEATENIINEATQAARVARSSLKSLKEQKKDAGRSPRHSQVAGNKYNNIHIPKIQGLSVRNSPVPPFQDLGFTATNGDIFQEMTPLELATPPFLVGSNAPPAITEHISTPPSVLEQNSEFQSVGSNKEGVITDIPAANPPVDFDDVEMNEMLEDPYANEGYDNFLPSTPGGGEIQVDVEGPVGEPEEIDYDAIFENFFEIFGHQSS